VVIALKQRAVAILSIHWRKAARVSKRDRLLTRAVPDIGAAPRLSNRLIRSVAAYRFTGASPRLEPAQNFE